MHGPIVRRLFNSTCLSCSADRESRDVSVNLLVLYVLVHRMVFRRCCCRRLTGVNANAIYSTVLSHSRFPLSESLRYLIG